MNTAYTWKRIESLISYTSFIAIRHDGALTTLARIERFRGEDEPWHCELCGVADAQGRPYAPIFMPQAKSLEEALANANEWLTKERGFTCSNPGEIK